MHSPGHKLCALTFSTMLRLMLLLAIICLFSIYFQFPLLETNMKRKVKTMKTTTASARVPSNNTVPNENPVDQTIPSEIPSSYINTMTENTKIINNDISLSSMVDPIKNPLEAPFLLKEKLSETTLLPGVTTLDSCSVKSQPQIESIEDNANLIFLGYSSASFLSIDKKLYVDTKSKLGQNTALEIKNLKVNSGLLAPEYNVISRTRFLIKYNPKRKILYKVLNNITTTRQSFTSKSKHSEKSTPLEKTTEKEISEKSQHQTAEKQRESSIRRVFMKINNTGKEYVVLKLHATMSEYFQIDSFGETFKVYGNNKKAIKQMSRNVSYAWFKNFEFVGSNKLHPKIISPNLTLPIRIVQVSDQNQSTVLKVLAGAFDQNGTLYLGSKSLVFEHDGKWDAFPEGCVLLYNPANGGEWFEVSVSGSLFSLRNEKRIVGDKKGNNFGVLGNGCLIYAGGMVLAFGSGAEYKKNEQFEKQKLLYDTYEDPLSFESFNESKSIDESINKRQNRFNVRVSKFLAKNPLRVLSKKDTTFYFQPCGHVFSMSYYKEHRIAPTRRCELCQTNGMDVAPLVIKRTPITHESGDLPRHFLTPCNHVLSDEDFRKWIVPGIRIPVRNENYKHDVLMKDYEGSEQWGICCPYCRMSVENTSLLLWPNQRTV